MSMGENMLTIGNYNYAGTDKFVSHAMDEECRGTLCGMHAFDLLTRVGQEWDFGESEIIGCKRCQCVLARISQPEKHENQ